MDGNDVSKRTDTSQFEEKYDELLGFIISLNSKCIIYICKVLPRDVDVSDINASITRTEHCIKIKLRSFKSSVHINEKWDGPYRGFGYLSLLNNVQCQAHCGN